MTGKQPNLEVTLDAPLDPMLGVTIDDRYRVERPIGVGGMGIVYEAVHVGLAKKIAVKVLRPDIANDPVAVERFRREASSATTVGNDHILDVLDFGTLPSGESYFAMEYLDGTSLLHTIFRESPIPIERVLHIAIQLADALGAAHRQGIVHRDVKPDNVFLVERDGDRDYVKVLDFGIALVTGAATKITGPGEVFGSPEYMSPEQCRGEAMDARADVYSFGVLLFELIAGRRPISGSSFFELVEAQLVATPPKLRGLRPECSPALEAVVMRCLEKAASDRYADCGVVADELRLIADGLAPKRAHRRTHRHATRRRRSLTRIAFAVGLVLFGYAGYLAMNPPRGGWFAAVVDRRPTSEREGDLTGVPIRLESVPEGAEVFVNEELVGITPCEAPRPVAGQRFDLVFTKPGYENRVVSVSSATIGRLLRYSLVPIRRSVARDPEPEVLPTTPLPPPPPPPPPPRPTRRRDDTVREVVDPWE